MSRQLHRLRARYPEMIHAAYVDQDGAWIEFNPGWTNPTTGTHSIHEGTVREALAAMKWTVRCDCESCMKATK
jgi:hypothetical protein